MYLAFDFETSAKPKHLPWIEGSYVSTLTITEDSGSVSTFVFRHKERDRSCTDREKVRRIQQLVMDASTIICHHIKFDLHWLRHLGVTVPPSTKLYCTLVGEYLLRAQHIGDLDLDSVAESYGLGSKNDEVQGYWDSQVETEDIPLPTLLTYNEQDVALTLAIARRQAVRLKEEGLWKLAQVQMEEIRCLVDIESNGMLVDQNERQRIEDTYEHRRGEVRARLAEITGRPIDVGSPVKLSCVLYGGHYPVSATRWLRYQRGDGSFGIRRKKNDKVEKYYPGLGFKPLENTERKDRKGCYSTKVDVLKQLYKQAKTPLKKEVLDLLVELSAVDQTLGTFVRPLQPTGGVVHPDGHIHQNMNQTIAITGRLTSSNPNGQNFPRDTTAPVRGIFVPEGWFVDGDLASLEWRVAAFLSQCPVMVGEILDGIDPHQRTLEEIFKGGVERVICKIHNFRRIYGGSAYSFFMDPKMPAFSLKKWKELENAFNEKYYGLHQWQEGLVRQVRREGSLRNPTGRLFKFDKYQTRYGKDYKRPQILNYPVQSLATGDIVPLAMVEIAHTVQFKGINAKPVNQVHDSIVYDAVDEEARDAVAQIMLDVFRKLPYTIEERFGFPFNVPLDGEIKVSNKNWRDMEVWNEC